MAFHISHKSRGKRSVARQRTFVPQLEILEARTLPSTLTVLNNLDSGAGSLRDAIKNANSGDTIVFASSLNGQTITLTSGELAVSKSLDVEGPGAGLLAISGNDANRVFDISGELTVTIAGLTITHGRAPGDGFGTGACGGSGILNVGSTLNVKDDVLSFNTASFRGGAISNDNSGAILTATNSTFIDNQALGLETPGLDAEGGGIWNSDHGSTATIIGCIFADNQALGGNGGVAATGNSLVGRGAGGAIHNGAGSVLTVENTIFTDNLALGGSGGMADKNARGYAIDVANGGAITNDDGGALVIGGCSFSHNFAIGGSNTTGNGSGGRLGNAAGGAVFNEGPATITGTAFQANEARGGSGNKDSGGFAIVGRAAGGAIDNQNVLSVTVLGFERGIQVNLTVSNSSFGDNKALGGNNNTGGGFAGDALAGAISNEIAAMATLSNTGFVGNQAIGGNGGTGSPGGDAMGGALANAFGAIMTLSDCTLSGNQAMGGAGGAFTNGGSGFAGGLYNDGLSLVPQNAGTPSTLTVAGTTITDNTATGGAAGSGGRAGQGVGGGVYFNFGGVVCLDPFTSLNIAGNTASTSNDDVFGVFAIC